MVVGREVLRRGRVEGDTTTLHNIGRDCINCTVLKPLPTRLPLTALMRQRPLFALHFHLKLRELYRLYPDQVPPVPDTIPTTHTDCGQCRSGGGGRGGRGGRGSRGEGGRRGGGRGSRGWGSSSARQQPAQVGAGAAGEEPNAESSEQHQKTAAPRRRSQPERQARRKRERSNSGLDSSDEFKSGDDNVDSSDEESANNNGADDVGCDDEDGLPAPIPDGFTAVPWTDGTGIAVGRSFMIWTALTRRAGSARWYHPE
eukprot:4237914-Pleurochrysis_carterae.AAC.1